MPLIKDKDAVDTAAVETAQAEASKATHAAEAEVEDNDSVLEPEPQAEPVVSAPKTEVAAREEGTVASRRAASQAVAMSQLDEAGHGGLHIDFSSFPSIVLKDGEFQVAGSTRSFSATSGFEGIVTGSREKFAMRVGGDDDGDVVFSDNKADFNNPETEQGQKVAEWKAAGLRPELKAYLECYVMVTTIHDDAADDLVGGLVVVQVSPTSIGRYSGYAATQQFKHKAMPDQYITRFCRGEKITSGKFPYYPWAFKFVSMA